MIQQIYPQPEAHGFRYELNKDMQFAAAHYVPHESAGICQNIHGHTYFVNVTIAGNELDAAGFLIDFKKVKDIVHKEYDHTILNNHDHFAEGGRGPTTEVVAATIWWNIQRHLSSLPNKPVCLQVFVRETPTSYIVFRPMHHDFSRLEEALLDERG